MKAVTLLLMLTGIGGIVKAQIRSGKERTTAVHLSLTDGLPQNSIRGAAFDANGLLWCSTEAGLFTYDGRMIRTINRQNCHLIDQERLRDIVRCLDGNLMIKDVDGKVYQVDRQSRLSVCNQKVFAGDGTLSLTGEVRTPGEYLEYYPRLVGIRKIEEDETMILLRPDSNRIVGLRRTMMLWNDAGGPVRIIATPIENPRNTFYLHGQLYYFDAGRFWRFDFFRRNLVPVALHRPNAISSIRTLPGQEKIVTGQMGGDTAIMVMGNKLLQITGSTNGKLHVTLLSSILNPNEKYLSIACDRQSNVIAVGTSLNGLYIFYPRTCTTVKPASAADLPSFDAQFAIDSNSVFAGSHFRFNIRGEMNNSPLNMVSPPKSCFRDSGRSVWLCYRDSLFHYLLEKGTAVLTRQPVAGRFRSFFRTGDSLWFAENDAGIGYIIDDTVYHSYADIDILHDKDYNGVIRGSAGDIWFATSRGLFHIDERKKIDTVKEALGMNVRTIKRFGDCLFLGTYGSGFHILQGNRLLSPKLDKAKRLLFSHDFIPDNNGFIWIPTNNGLLRTSMHDLIDYAADPDFQPYYQIFAEEDGISNSEFNGPNHNMYSILSGGYICISSIGGLVWLQPSHIQAYLPASAILIDSIVAKNGNCALGDSISLPSTAQSLHIDFSTAYWGNPQNLWMEYRLINFDSTWTSIPANEKSLNLYLPGSGTYLLEIRKRCGYGKFDFITKRLTIIVQKKIFEQTWFKMLAACTSILFVFLLMKAFRKDAEKRNALLSLEVAKRTSELEESQQILERSRLQLVKQVDIKTKLLSIISHDIAPVLSYVRIKTASLADAGNQAEAGIQEELMDISFSADELLTTIRSFLYWNEFNAGQYASRQQFTPLYPMMESVVNLYKGEARRKQILLHNNCDEELIVPTDPILLRIITSNLLSNAIKYCGAGDEVLIGSDRKHNHYTITISDTGQGMTQEQIDEIYRFLQGSSHFLQPERKSSSTKLGYQIISDLLKIANGQLRIESIPGLGTRVHISFPDNTA